MARALIAVLLLALAGCASREVKVPKEVVVERPVACLSRDKMPVYPRDLRSEGDILAMDEYKATIALWDAAKRLRAYANEAAAALEGCSRIPR